MTLSLNSPAVQLQEWVPRLKTPCVGSLKEFNWPQDQYEEMVWYGGKKEREREAICF